MDGDSALVGISEFAASELGDITFLELPDVGATLTQGDPIGVVESVKAAEDIYAPAGGTVTEVNTALEERPELVNESAEKDGWIVKLSDVKEDDFDTLMSEDDYAEYIDN